ASPAPPPCCGRHSADLLPTGASPPRAGSRRYGRPIRLPLHGQRSLTPVAGRHGAYVEADPAGTRTMSSTPRWSPGDQVTWTYYTPQHPTRTVRPGTVVLDDDRGVVVWIAPGTEVLLPVLESGAALRRAGDEGMFTAPRVQSKQLWTGNGIL